MKAVAWALVIAAVLCAPASGQTKLADDCQAGRQVACAQLARLGVTLETRLAAVRRLTDQAAIADLARTAADSRVRLAAIRGLIDQDALARIAQWNKSATERAAAIERLNDQALVADLARKDSSKWVRRRAAGALKDEQLITTLVGEGRRELLPTITVGSGLKRVTIDGKPLVETLLGIATVFPGRHTLSADFLVQENVTWDSASVTTVEFDARLGASYVLEGEAGIVHWDYLSPKTRRGTGTWKLAVREEVSSGPDLLPQLLRR